jgi:hypothetical protein
MVRSVANLNPDIGSGSNRSETKRQKGPTKGGKYYDYNVLTSSMFYLGRWKLP